MAAALCRETIVWVGPASQKEVREDFLSIFGARVVNDADVWSNLDDPLKIYETRRQYGQEAGVPDDELMTASLDKFMATATAKKRATSYMKKVAEMAGARSGTCAIDQSQNPVARKRGSPWLPTLCRSTDAVLLFKDDPNKCYIYTPAELAFSQGWPSLPDTVPDCKEFFGDLRPRWLSLSKNQMAQLLGGGMHLYSMTAFTAYILSNIVRRDLVREYMPDLRLLFVERGDLKRCRAAEDSEDESAPKKRSPFGASVMQLSPSRKKDSITIGSSSNFAAAAAVKFSFARGASALMEEAPPSEEVAGARSDHGVATGDPQDAVHEPRGEDVAAAAAVAVAEADVTDAADKDLGEDSQMP